MAYHGASKEFTVDHLKSNIQLVEKATVFYMAVSFISLSVIVAHE